jgi:hypothetical protein
MRLLPVNEKKGVLLLALANVVAALSLSGVLQANEFEERPCSTSGNCRCEFQGTAGGFCSGSGGGSPCTSNSSCGKNPT